MPVKPEVTITLSCCPRCGWPNDEDAAPTASAKANAPRVEARAAPAAVSAPQKERALDPDAFKRAIQHGWGPRSFGVTQEQWRTHWTKDILERWHSRYMCQRQDHTHDEAGTLDCMEESFATQPKRKPGRPKDPLKDLFARWQELLCYPDQHTHGDYGLLDCVMLQMLMREIELPPEVTAPAAQAPLASAARDQAFSFDAAGKPMGPSAVTVRDEAGDSNVNSRGTSRRSAGRRAG